MKIKLYQKNALLTALLLAGSWETSLRAMAYTSQPLNAVSADYRHGAALYSLEGQTSLRDGSTDKVTPASYTPLGIVRRRITAAAEFTVKGRVTDEQGGGLPGVSVLLKGTNTGTATDPNGSFSLTIPTGEGTLVFSFIGYVSQEVSITTKTTIDVTLVPDIKALGEVIVVGYGTQKKETLTGSVAAVQGKELVKSPQPNVANTLAGRTPGLIVSNSSGEPGYDGAALLIRGQSTTGNNNPLVVIDGVANRLGGLERLNPNDIESISVLKDASAAIYGAQAANGVILITTKRGTTGKPVFSYSFNQGFAMPTRLPDMADAATYATILNEIDVYNGRTPRYTDADIALYQNGSDPLNHPNTNWLKEVIKPVSLQNQHNLSVRGGTERISYFLSLGKLHQDGLYKKGVTKYDQYSIRTNVDVNVNERVKIGFDLAGRQEDRLFPRESAGSIFRALYRTYPTIPAYYPNGLAGAGVEQGLNPAVIVTDAGGTTRNPRTILNGLIRGSYQLPFLEGLSIDGFLAADKTFDFSKNFQTPWIVYTYDKNNGQYNQVKGGPPLPQLTQSQTNVTLITANAKLNFSRQFEKHFISAFIAYEQSEMSRENFGTSRLNFLSTQLPQLSQGGAQATDVSNYGDSARIARRNYFTRITYNFSEKYLAELQLRYDGSTTFPKGNQFGLFPGISVGWRISEEPWFKNNVSFMPNLKIRASYGLLGNDRVPYNQFFDNFSLQNGAMAVGYTPTPVTGIAYTRLANPNITWETARKYNIGLDGSFFGNLTFEFDLYKERRNNLLTPRNISIPAVSGITSDQIPQENMGTVENQGVEAQVGYSRKTGSFGFNVGGNFTYNRSKVLFLDDAPSALSYQKREGYPLFADLMYNAIGLFRSQEELDNYPHVPGATPGDLKFQDYDNDGQITAADRVRQPLTNVPQLIFGVTMGANWKNFDLSILFQGQGRSRQYILTEAGEIGNYFSTWADNRWSPANPNGSYPKVDSRASSSISGTYRNTFWLQNTAFVRLKNLEIGYNVPESLMAKIKLGGARVYFNGFNLFTLSKVKDFDPEGRTENAQFYPQQRIFNLGVNVSF